MKAQFIGIALMVIGIALGVWGYDVYDSASSQLSRAFSGDTPFEAWLGMIGGAICFCIGAFKLR